MPQVKSGPSVGGRRSDVSATSVARTLRSRILAGDWQPGSQIPTWTDLETDLNVARTTLAKAVRQLKRDGFVYSASTRGTFVSEYPPHLYRYALAFRGEPNSPAWLRFWWALANEATAWSQNNTQHLVPFYGVGGSDNTESHQRLMAQVEADRFAGVIFVGYPPEISDQLLHHPWLAKVAIGDSPRTGGLARLYPDRGSFIRRSLEYMRQRQCKRVAVVTGGNPEFAAYDAAIPEYGMSTKSYFRVAATLHDPTSAKHIVQLLMDRPEADRPDALIITDDNLVESALAGVMASGVQMPGQLQVLAHCNWPAEVGSQLPIKRLGFDASELLRRAIALVEAVRNGRRAPQRTPVAAVFDDEVSSAARPSSPAGVI